MEIFYSNDISGDLVRLNAEESAHCVRVLRHRVGDEIAVMDGCGTLLWCVLEDASVKEAVARVVRREPGFGSHPYRLTLAVCPTKNFDRYEWMAEKATEVGLDVLAPVFGDRSERRVLKGGRLQRILLSAAKQSLKGAVPVLAEPVTVKEFIAGLGPADGSLRMIAYCSDEVQPRSSIMEELRRARPGEIVVLIGPEGDFSPEEVRAAMDAGFVPVSLGGSRLRTETAAITAAEAVYLSLI